MAFMTGLRVGQSMTSTSCSARKVVVSRAVGGMALSWAYKKVPSKNARHPGKHNIAVNPGVALVVEGST